MTINIDFDGTCTTHEFPLIGKDIGAADVLRKLTDKGHKLILFTMRSNKKLLINTYGFEDVHNEPGNYLDEAVNWFKENNIPLYGIQTNPGQDKWTDSPKSYAELMIDDSSLGCPLIYDNNVSSKPYVDWKEVEKYLINKKIL